MLENIADAFALFLTVDNAFSIFAGVVIGVVIGAIPGMTTPMGVACLPRSRCGSGRRSFSP